MIVLVFTAIQPACAFTCRPFHSPVASCKPQATARLVNSHTSRIPALLTSRPRSRPTGPSILAVGTSYGILGFGLCLSVARGILTATEATVGVALVWTGLVLGISFLEAWVKFRAPFLPLHLGLDVGRTVFPTLNAAEVAMAATLTASHAMGRGQSWRWLGSLVAMQAFEAFYLTPRLVLIGKHVIYQALAAPGENLTEKQWQALVELQHEVEHSERPPVALHVAYVVSEMVKLAVLARIVWRSIRS